MLTIVTNQTSPFDATIKALMHSKWGFSLKSQQIFIKPNIGATSKSVNTDLEVVRAIIHYCKGPLKIEDIVIGEGSVETEYESTTYNYHFQGWDKLAQEEKVELIDLNKAEREECLWQYGTLKLPTILKNRTYINVAKMKTHMQTLVSLCIKNQKGVLDSTTRKKFHMWGLHEPLARLSNVLKPDLCVVDGIEAIEGNGPGNLGKKRKLGIIVVGDDMIEVDSICCKIMGISPSEVQHLYLLPRKNPNIKIPEIKPFLRPDKFFKMFNVYMRPENACTACLSSVGKTNKLARKTLSGLRYFLKHGFFNRLDIVVGSPQDLPNPHGFCIFYGSCAKKLSSKYPQYPFIEGCPPTSKEALEELIKFDVAKN